MRSFSSTADIAASADRVWQVMIDVERWHEWTASIASVTLLDGSPLAVGRRAKIRQPKLPAAVWRVTAIEPGRSFTWISVAPGIRVVAKHQIEPTAFGCRASLSLDIEGPFGGLLGRLTGDITRYYLGLEAAGLKQRSERPEVQRHGDVSTAQQQRA
ncbi:MAG: SRPBCC family protein [bacterium]